MKTTAVSHKPGDIVKIAGTEFAVLDVKRNAAPDDADELFVLLREPVGNTKFNDCEKNSYANSDLYRAVNVWFYEDFAKKLHDTLKIYGRKINLLTLDGRADYGSIDCLAAPLTFDEYRRYHKYIPISEKASWLATGDSAPGRLGALYALLIAPDGYCYSSYCANSVAVRPAMIVSSLLLDDEESNLSRYTTEQLLEEIRNRMKEESGNDTEAGESVG